jgi:amino acid transporter
VFAFARDGALPGSKIWSHVDRRTRTPVNATWGLMLISALLGLLMFAGPVVMAAVFSIGG